VARAYRKQVSRVKMSGADHIENTTSSIVAKARLPCRYLATEMFVVTGICLATCFLAMDIQVTVSYTKYFSLGTLEYHTNLPHPRNFLQLMTIIKMADA
jgi:hypothetical protein